MSTNKRIYVLVTQFFSCALTQHKCTSVLNSDSLINHKGSTGSIKKERKWLHLKIQITSTNINVHILGTHMPVCQVCMIKPDLKDYPQTTTTIPTTTTTHNWQFMITRLVCIHARWANNSMSRICFLMLKWVFFINANVLYTFFMSVMLPAFPLDMKIGTMLQTRILHFIY